MTVYPPVPGKSRRITALKEFYLHSCLLHCIFNLMVEYSSKVLDRTFGALADPTRRRILTQLARGAECVTNLARPHAMSLAAVSKHLIVLERAGLVKRRRDGRVHSLALEAKPMKEAQAWLDRYRKFWEGNLDQFEMYLDKLQEKESKHEDDE
jgi:DNA-binding transcriptional ArsR family regulator